MADIWPPGIPERTVREESTGYANVGQLYNSMLYKNIGHLESRQTGLVLSLLRDRRVSR
jgi:hypothetical protein